MHPSQTLLCLLILASTMPAQSPPLPAPPPAAAAVSVPVSVPAMMLTTSPAAYQSQAGPWAARLAVQIYLYQLTAATQREGGHIGPISRPTP